MKLLSTLFVSSTLFVAATTAIHANSIPELQDVAPNTGVLITPAGLYQFTATACSVGVYDGQVEAEVYGPGTAPDGEIMFFTFSAVANALSIELGKDKMVGATERELVAGQHHTEPFVTEVTGLTVEVRDLVLATQDQTRLDGTAALLINCAPA